VEEVDLVNLAPPREECLVALDKVAVLRVALASAVELQVPVAHLVEVGLVLANHLHLGFTLFSTPPTPFCNLFLILNLMWRGEHQGVGPRLDPKTTLDNRVIFGLFIYLFIPS
jgi:hypothetical protein